MVLGVCLFMFWLLLCFVFCLCFCCCFCFGYCFCCCFCLCLLFCLFCYWFCFFLLLLFLFLFLCISPNSACARGSGSIVCFDCPFPPPAVANFCLPSSSVASRVASSGVSSWNQLWPILRLRRGGRAASSFWNAHLCCDGFMFARTNMPHSKTRLQWGHPGALVAFCCVANYVHGVALPAELAGRARTQNLRSRGLPWSPNKMFFRRTCLVGLSWPPVCFSANLSGWPQLNSHI